MSVEPVRAVTNPHILNRAQLFEKAKELETAFLSEMLAHAGLGESPEGFGGGIGEDQFASYLRNAQARMIVEKSGIGLAQTIFESLAKSQEAHHGR